MAVVDNDDGDGQEFLFCKMRGLIEMTYNISFRGRVRRSDPQPLRVLTVHQNI